MLLAIATSRPVLAQTAAPVLPTEGAFVRGAGQISQPSATQLDITQSTQNGVIDWRSFSIGQGGEVALNNGSGATLNRVNGGDISRIDGLLTATGSAYLMNPNGVIVGPGGQVLTNGNFVATTRDIDPDAFMAGGALTAKGHSAGDIVNGGNIVSRQGSVILIARNVSNTGTIDAASGQVTLAAADDVLMTPINGDGGRIYVAAATGGGDITQGGRISAAAVALQAAGGNIYALAAKNDGLTEATGSATIDGQLWLTAPKGTVEVAGALAARNADGSGGTIQANGKLVQIGSTAQISAVGTSGGDILIGTSQFGTGQNLADTTRIASGAHITAGGPSGGGRIETSGHVLDIGAATIIAGKGGEWLVDPDDLTIDTAAASALVTSLNAGTNVTQGTSAGGTGGNGDIFVNAQVTWTGTGNLTLNAIRDFNLNAAISGGGSITLTAAHFVNNAEASALSSASGRWLVYSGDPANDTTGGLTPAFYQYNAPAGTTPAAGGNGLLYSIAPSIGVTLGTIQKSYDGTTTATLNTGNTTVTGLINGDTWTLDGAYATRNAGTGLGVTASNFAAAHNGLPVYGYTVPAPVATSTTGIIDPAVLIGLVIGNPTKTYNATTTISLTAANLQLLGVATGETITLNGASSAAYTSADAGEHTVNATLATSNFTLGAGADADNYVLPTTATGLGHINPASLTITGVTANDKVYDSTTAATLNTGGAALFGVISGDTVTLGSGGATGTFTSKTVGTNIAVTAAGFILAGASAGNYIVASPTGLVADITRATLQVSGIVANNKVYDGNTIATLDLSSATVTGRYAGDDVTIDNASGATAAFASKNVGNNIGVSISGVSLTGADVGNYNLSTSATPLTANITPRPMTLSVVGNPTKVYDGTTAVGLTTANAALSGTISGESITIGQASSFVYDSKNAGARQITANLSPSDYTAGPDTLLSNYILPVTATGAGTITQAPLEVTIIGDPTKPYDGNANASLTPANFEVTGFVAPEGATVNQPNGLYASADAGVWTVTASLSAANFTPDSGTLMSNYSIPATASGFGTITTIPIGTGVLTASITGNPTKYYDGNTVATLISSDYTMNGFITGEGATITQTVGTYGAKDAGTQSVLALLAPGDFVANSGTNLANYTLPTQATGLGTILATPLLISIIGNPTKVYNGTTNVTLQASNYAYSGLIAGESVTLSLAVPASYDNKNAGSRTVTSTFARTNIVAGPNTLLSNYVLPTQATGPGTITKAQLTILNASALSKVYDTTATAQINTSGAALFGAVTGDAVTLQTAGATGLFATPNVGNGIAVTVSGFALSGADLANYNLIQPTGLTANITPKGLIIANVDALDKVYDGTTLAALDLGSATLQGVLAGDTVTLNSGSAASAFRQSNVGTNITVNVSGFTISGGSSGNYSLSQPSGVTANITPALLTGTIINNPSKTYDGTTSAFLNASNYSLTGFITGEGGTLTQSSGAQYDTPNAGARTVTSNVVVSDIVANSGTSLANYQLPTTISGAGLITQASLAVAIVNNPTKVYDATQTATLTTANYRISGFVSGEGATIGQTTGLYASRNVGTRSASALLVGTDYTPNGTTNLNNYILPGTALGSGTITPASINVINVTAQDKIYDGNRNATLNSGAASLTGVFAGDTVTVVSSAASGLFASKNVGTNIAVTASGYTISGTDAANYTVVQPTGLLADITQATISLASVTKVYDTGTLAPAASSAYTLSGVVSGDVVTVNTGGLSGNYADKNVGTGIGITLSGVALAGTDAGNYLISPTTSNALIGIITPATLTVTGAAADNKVYDQTTLATLNNTNTVLTGVLGSDSVILSNGSATGQFNNANAGTNKPVTTTAYSISGTDSGNYTLQQPNYLTANITQREIFLAWVRRVYNGNTSLPNNNGSYGFTGVISGDDVTANASTNTGAYADKNVGGSLSGGVVTDGINVSVANLGLTGADAGNYFVADVVNQPIGVILPQDLTVAIIGNPTKVYDTTTAATLTGGNYQLTGFVTGEGATITETNGVYNSRNVDAITITAALTGSDYTADSGTLLTNYTLPTTANGAGAITPKALTVSGILATTKVYDGNTSDTLTTGGAVLNGVIGSDTTALDSSGATGTFVTPDVGTGIAVTATGFTLTNNTLGNYTLIQPTGLFADITAALLSLVRVERVYTAGTELPTAASAYTLSGIVGSDVVSVSTATLSGSYASKNVGTNIGVTYAGLALSGTDAGNYSIAPSASNALIGVITPATVSLSGMLANTKIYDGLTTLTLNNSGTTVVGTLGTDNLGVNSGGSSAAFPSVNVGTYSVAASGYVLTGSDAGNYILTQPTGISATITPKQLTAAITGTPAKTYDGNTAAALTNTNYALTGLIGSESATVSQTTGLYDSQNAGARTVTATLASGDFTAGSGTLLSNYVLPTTASGAGLINQATLTAAIINDPTRIYNGTNAATLTATNYQLTGFVTGESATVTRTVGTYDSPNAGARTVTTTLSGTDFTAGSGTLLTNYILPTTASGAGHITAAQLIAAIIGNPTKIYNGTNAATLASGNYQITGFIGSDSASVTETAGLYDSTHAGARTVTATLSGGDFTAVAVTDLSNYILPTTASGTGTITPAILTATLIGTPTKTYDGTLLAHLTSANFNLSGFIGGESATATVSETTGVYDNKNVGSHTLTATFASGNFVAGVGTLASDYILPTIVTGTGVINQAPLTASIIGLPSRIYNGNTNASLTSGNFTLTGFASGEGATITQTAGQYNSPNAGIRSITSSLASGEFSADTGTLLSNYILPTSATGAGIIYKATLSAAIIGTPTKTYDGNTVAILTSASYDLTGFVSGEGGTVTETAGTYSSQNAGSRTVTANLGSPDFTANSGTLLSNYNLPLTASGAGQIDRATLTAAIIGNPTKIYDGNTVAPLTTANYSLGGFITGESATITQTSGTYDGPNAGNHTVTATLTSGNFAANSGTLMSNYVLPTTATGTGLIDKASLIVVLSGVRKTYDGTMTATLIPGNYTLVGFVTGEGAMVTETNGTYASPNAGPRLVSASLDTTDFVFNSGTLAANYTLPTMASGTGLIDKATLIAAIIGDPTRIYDGSTSATLTSADYSLLGFISGEGATITQTSGVYGSQNAGLRTVIATLGDSDYTAAGSTLLSNYTLPVTAAGTGHITPKTLTASLIGTPTRTYDGTTSALLTPANFDLSGFITGEGGTVTETQGTYGGPNAGPHQVTTTLDGGDFAADFGTTLSNYVLPTTASGLGLITRASLSALIIGNPTKTYDGTANATLSDANYQLVGLAPGENLTISQTAGLYGSPNAGTRIVTADLSRSDFTAGSGVLLTNYILPDSATGLGTIDPALLQVAITGNPTRSYDSTTTATLTPASFTLSGFIGSEGATVTQTLGTYDSRNAGSRTVTTSLDATDYAAASGTLLTNYVLPTTASGDGQIDRSILTAAIIGNPSRPYDGTTDASLTAVNFQLSGFAPGEGATVTQTFGIYDDRNAGSRTVTASLSAGDFSIATAASPSGLRARASFGATTSAAESGTLLSNYILPTEATGTGTITRAVLTATIIGNPTKFYDAITLAQLDSGNYQLDGFAVGEGATVTQTVGQYDSPAPGSHTVTAQLAGTDFDTGTGTLLSNYILPMQAVGPGTIRANRDPIIPDIVIRFFRPLGNPRFYIPFPSAYTIAYAHTNGFAALPIIESGLHRQTEDGEETDTGAAIFNAPEDILEAGRAGKVWQIRYPREPVFHISGISN